MGEAIVVLSLDSCSDEDVKRGNSSSPFHIKTFLDPLAVLVDYRVDDVDERLIAVE
jgi:hypothetical protein